jgi:hypothetical protein
MAMTAAQWLPMNPQPIDHVTADTDAPSSNSAEPVSPIEPELVTRHDADSDHAHAPMFVDPALSPFADTVTTAEALRLYDAAGVARSERSLQRYCLSGELRAQKSFDGNGMMFYLIDRQSIADHIAHLQSAAQRMPPRPPAFQALATDRTLPPPSQYRQPSARGTAMAMQHMAHSLTLVTSDRDFLRRELDMKNEQIRALNEQSIASSRLIGSLQAMIETVSAFLPRPKKDE